MSTIIHQRSKLEAKDHRRLHANGVTQEARIAKFFRDRPDEKFNLGEVILAYPELNNEGRSIDKTSCNRSISNLSNTKPSAPYLDENGQPPLLKLNEKRVNPLSGVEIGLYQWNPLYGKKAEQQQLSMFGSGDFRI